MCEFCLKHGEGKKWYLQAKNYSEDLLSDVARRDYIREFFSHPEAYSEGIESIAAIKKAPLVVQRGFKQLVTRKMKKVHYGQVVPIEEVEKIFEFINSVVRIACMCRTLTEKKERRYCYAMSIAPNGGALAEILRGLDKSFLFGPNTQGLEVLSKDEALAAIRNHEKEGLCHSIWTFHTPFIAGLCNCDQKRCLAMQATVTHDTPLMLRAEYLAEVDHERCVGCGSCIETCQFDALSLPASSQKAIIASEACYGCGICRSACPVEAISLHDHEHRGS